jgi:hypothetical protein
MQALALTLIETLKPDRYGDPALVLDPAGIDQISIALNAAGAPADGPPPPPTIAAAGMALLKDRHYLAAAHLAAAGGDAPSLIHCQAMALHKLRAQDALSALIATHGHLVDTSPLLRKTFDNLRIKNQIGLTVQSHREFVDGAPATLDQALTRLRLNLSQPPSARETRLFELRAIPGEQLDDFIRRFRWGHRAADYLRFLRQFDRTARGTGNKRATHQNIRKLAQQVAKIFVPPDPDILLQASDGGRRSVVLCIAHAGISSPFRLIPVPEGLIPAQVLANGKTNLDRTDWPGRQLGVSGDFQRDFLKLVKLTKKEPHLIRIAPDGASGTGLLPFDFLGGQVNIGQGAATLGWHAQAAVVFSASRWQDNRLHLDYRLGPVVDKATGREAFDRAFYDFYLNCCRNLVMGPPEDMASPGGGFWSFLRSQEEEITPSAVPGHTPQTEPRNI